MRRVLPCLACLVASSSALAGPVAPQKEWRQVVTPNFRVIGNAAERDLRHAATRLEQFRDALGILFPKAVLVAPAPTTVIVFRGEREYEPFKPLHDGRPRDVAGYFLPGRTANYVTTAAAGIESFGRIVYHEYVHLVVSNTLERVPLWFNEGLAEYFATFEVTAGGRQASLGVVQPDHVLRLRQQWLPLATLLAAGHDSPHYNERDKASVFYAESWALVHYLLLGSEGKYAGRLAPFLSELASGVGPEDACRRAFSVPVAGLERELRRYVERERFLRQQVTFTARIAPLERVPVTPLPEPAAHAALADLLLRMQRPDEARAHVEAALALAPALPEAHAVIGRLLLASDRKADAMPHLARAAASPGAPWSAHFEYATLLLDARSAGAEDRDAEIEAALRRTIELQPSFPDAYVQLAALRSRAPEGAAEALGLAKRALALSPGNERYWLLIGGIHAIAEDYAAAKAVAERLATARDDDVRAEAATLLASVEGVLAHERASPVRAPAGRAGRARPEFRTPGRGEERLAGRLTEIRCGSPGTPVAFVVVSRGVTGVFEAASFEAVAFITYRPDLSGRVTCGAQASPVVILTFAPRGDGGPPRAIALEYVPEGYEPK